MQPPSSSAIRSDPAQNPFNTGLTAAPNAEPCLRPRGAKHGRCPHCRAVRERDAEGGFGSARGRAQGKNTTFFREKQVSMTHASVLAPFGSVVATNRLRKCRIGARCHDPLAVHAPPHSVDHCQERLSGMSAAIAVSAKPYLPNGRRRPATDAGDRQLPNISKCHGRGRRLPARRIARPPTGRLTFLTFIARAAWERSALP